MTLKPITVLNGPGKAQQIIEDIVSQPVDKKVILASAYQQLLTRFGASRESAKAVLGVVDETEPVS